MTNTVFFHYQQCPGKPCYEQAFKDYYPLVNIYTYYFHTVLLFNRTGEAVHHDPRYIVKGKSKARHQVFKVIRRQVTM